jgi:hypothetical protein
VPQVPPDFLSSFVALANLMRLSVQKAAHANLANAACRKSGSPKRTWAENVFFKCFHFINPKQIPGAPHPRFPVQSVRFRKLHAPFLTERRTRSRVQSSVQEIRGISLVFRERWDTANLNFVGARGLTLKADIQATFLINLFSQSSGIRSTRVATATITHFVKQITVLNDTPG